MTITEKGIAFFQGKHSKRRRGETAKVTDFLLLEKAISEQACRAVSRALQALSLIMLFESLCNSPSSPPAGSRDPIRPILPPHYPTPHTPSLLLIREKPQ